MKKFPLAKASPFYPKQACDPEENPLLRGGLFPFRPTPPWKRPQVGAEGCQSLQCLRRCRNTLWWQEEYGQNSNQSWHRTGSEKLHPGDTEIFPKLLLYHFPSPDLPSCLAPLPCMFARQSLPQSFTYSSVLYLRIYHLAAACCVYCDWRGSCGDAPFVENDFPTSCQTWVGKIVSVICNLLFFTLSVIQLVLKSYKYDSTYRDAKLLFKSSRNESSVTVDQFWHR